MPQFQPDADYQGEICSKFTGGLWTVGNGVDIPANACQTLTDFDLDRGGGLKSRNGMRGYTFDGMGVMANPIGYFSPGWTATFNGTGTVTFANPSGHGFLADGGIVGSDYLGVPRFAFVSIAADTNAYPIVSVGGGTTLNAATLTVNGTITAGTSSTWFIFLISRVPSLHRHYKPTDSSVKTFLMSYGVTLSAVDSSGSESLLSKSVSDGGLVPLSPMCFVQWNDVTYMCNGKDVPQRYDSVNGLGGVGGASTTGILGTAPATPTFLWSASAPTGKSAQTMATIQGPGWSAARTSPGTAFGSYGNRSAGNAQVNIVASQNQTRYAEWTTAYGYVGQTPYFFLSDLASLANSRNHTSGVTTSTTLATAGRGTVTGTGFNAAGITAGDVLYVDDKGGHKGFFYVISVDSDSSITVDYPDYTGRTYSSGQYVFLKSDFNIGSVLYSATAFADGATAVVGNTPTSDVHEGDMVLAFYPDTVTAGASATTAATKVATASPASRDVYRIDFTSASDLTTLGIEYNFRGNVFSMWEFSPDNGTHWFAVCDSAASASYGTAPVQATKVYVYTNTGASAPANGTAGNNIFRPQRGATGASSWGQGNFGWRAGVVKSVDSVGKTLNLYCHNGYMGTVAMSRTAILTGYSATGGYKPYGIELFKNNPSASGTSVYECTTLAGQTASPNQSNGVPGVCVADLKCETWATSYTQNATSPPIHRFAIVHQSRMCWFDITERDGSASFHSQFRCSYPGQPEAVDPLTFFTVGQVTGEGSITGAFVLHETLYVIKGKGIYSVQGELGGQPDIALVNANPGCVSWQSVAVGDGMAFWRDRDMVWAFNGVTATPIGAPIRNVLSGYNSSLSLVDTTTSVGFYRDNSYWLCEGQANYSGTPTTRQFRFFPWANAWVQYSKVIAAAFQGDNVHDSGQLFYLPRFANDLTQRVAITSGGHTTAQQVIMQGDIPERWGYDDDASDIQPAVAPRMFPANVTPGTNMLPEWAYVYASTDGYATSTHGVQMTVSAMDDQGAYTALSAENGTTLIGDDSNSSTSPTYTSPGYRVGQARGALPNISVKAAFAPAVKNHGMRVFCHGVEARTAPRTY